jgi:RNA-directed DNA polymerase
MNENENLSCALPHKLTNRETILWRKVIQHVTRLQRRIAKAVKEEKQSTQNANALLLHICFCLMHKYRFS